MTRSKTLSTLFAAASACLLTAPAHAVVGFADTVVDYFNSGAGPFPGPYGGTFPGSFPVPVSTSVVLGPDSSILDFLSLPTGSYVTIGFTDEIVFDQAGDDIFVREVGASGERANIFVTSDFLTYTFLGVAVDNVSTSFDLASIGYTGQVKGVRVIGLDNFGGSPGFDVANIQALAFVGQVPEPATWAMMIGGFGAIGVAARRRRRVTVAFA
jgi:PEP-CTERM motif